MRHQGAPGPCTLAHVQGGLRRWCGTIVEVMTYLASCQDCGKPMEPYLGDFCIKCDAKRAVAPILKRFKEKLKEKLGDNMKHEDQKELLKRLLRYARRNRTDAAKAYTILLSGSGRTGPTLKLEGKVEGWEQMVAYMESLLRELDDAIYAYESAPELEDAMDEADG